MTIFCSTDCCTFNNQEYVEQYCNMPDRRTVIRCVAVKENNLDYSILEDEGMYSEIYAKIRKPELLEKVLKVINEAYEKEQQIALYGYGEIAFDIIDYIERRKGSLKASATIIYTQKSATNYKGIPIILLDELSEYPKVNKICIVSLSKNALTIYDRICYLEEKGIKVIKIF